MTIWTTALALYALGVFLCGIMAGVDIGKKGGVTDDVAKRWLFLALFPVVNFLVAGIALGHLWRSGRREGGER